MFLSYVLSFIIVGIYWNNHHHMLHAVQRVNGAVLWGNLHLLFWLSLMPFTTGWMGENHFAAVPVAVYGVRAVHVGGRVLLPGPRDHRGARRRFGVRAAPGLRLEGQGVAARYALGDRAGVREPLDLDGDLRRDRGVVVHSGQEVREVDNVHRCRGARVLGAGC